MKIIDDFLSKDDFFNIQLALASQNFNWSFNNTIASANPNPDNFQFTHTFFTITNPYLEKQQSNQSHILKPLLLKLQPQFIFRVKANLRPRTHKHILSDFHTDYNLKQTTAIFYLNTCDGYTLFEDNTKVLSVANRILIFDGSLKHCGASCTDQKRRILINFNYIPGSLPDNTVYIPS